MSPLFPVHAKTCAEKKAFTLARLCRSLLLGGLLIPGLPAPAPAASFPCEKATTRVEKLICAYPALSALDEKLAASYRQALEKTRGDKEPLREGQRLWLAEKRDRCADAVCLKNTYEVRLAELELYTFGPVVKQAKPSTKPDTIPAAELGATGKYPPYPEVWGYELPTSVSYVWKIDNGDYLFVFSKRTKQTKLQNRSFVAERGMLHFMGGARSELASKEIDVLRNRFDNLSYDAFEQLTFPDGTTISLGGLGGSAHCYTSFPYHLQKKDKNGNVVARKSILHLRDKPRTQNLNPYCEGSGGKDSFAQRVGEIGYSLLPLADGTFIVYGGQSNIILRLDKDFRTKFSLLNDRVFVVDTGVIEDLIRRSAQELWKQRKYTDAQIIDDVVVNHLLTMKEKRQ